MSNYKVKQLEKMGKLKIKKIPNFSHKYSQEDYDTKLNAIEKDLVQIREILGKNLNRVQLRMLEICIKKIAEVFRYFFNTKTWKNNLQKNRVFKNYITELKNFKKKYFDLTEEERKLMDEIIEKLVHQFITQRDYILELEEEIKEGNITPFEDSIEILDNSIKKKNIVEE